MLGPCWHYVGSWAPFFRSWPLLERFLDFFGSCWSFFSSFGSLWTRICEVWGRFWSFQNTFFDVFGASQHTSQKCSSCNKTTVFAMFYRLRNMPHARTKHVSCVAFKAFLDMVHGLLPTVLAGIHFLLFKTTLQRGGTCEAH